MGVGEGEISPIFDTKYFYRFLPGKLSIILDGLIYCVSTRLQKENKQHVFDYILLLKTICTCNYKHFTKDLRQY